MAAAFRVVETAEEAKNLNDEEYRELYRLAGQARFEAREVLPQTKGGVFERLSGKVQEYSGRFEDESALTLPLRSLATHLTELSDLLENEG